MKEDRAIFLDRDGTLIHNQHYGSDPDRIELMGGVIEALRLFQQAGYRLVVVTNQSGIARGYFTEEQLLVMHDRLAEILMAHGIEIDGFYYCPHHVEGIVAGYSVECGCRKPRPGMIIRAAEELGIDPARSWMIGDILDDVEAGKAAGCRAVLVDLGTEGEPSSPLRTPDYVARDLLDAAMFVLASAPVESAQESKVG